MSEHPRMGQARSAHAAGVRRLIAAHLAEWDIIHDEERAKFGLPSAANRAERDHQRKVKAAVKALTALGLAETLAMDLATMADASKDS